MVLENINKFRKLLDGTRVEAPINVRGVTFDDRQEVLKEICKKIENSEETPLTLERETGNIDSNAVAIFVELDGEKRQVGYVPKEGAPHISMILDHPGYESAEHEIKWCGTRGHENTYGLKIVARFSPVEAGVFKKVVF